MSSSRVLTHVTHRVAGDRAHGSLLPSRSSILDIQEASGPCHAAVPQHHSSSRCPQGQSRSSHATTGVFFTQGALRCRWLHGGVAARVPVSPLGQVAKGWGHQGAQAMGQGGDGQTDRQQQDGPAAQPTSRTRGWGHIPLAAGHRGRVTCRTWWGHPTAPPGRAHGDGVAVRGAKGTLGGAPQVVPRADPKSGPAPCQSPSHTASPTLTSPAQEAKPQTPRKQDPKLPSQAAPQKQDHKPKSYLTAPTRRMKHQAPTRTLSFYLMSQLSSSWSQLAQVPPQLLIKPLAQQRGCGDRSYKKQAMGFGLPGREFGPSPSQPPSRDGIAVLENEPSPLMR